MVAGLGLLCGRHGVNFLHAGCDSCCGFLLLERDLLRRRAIATRTTGPALRCKPEVLIGGDSPTAQQIPCRGWVYNAKIATTAQETASSAPRAFTT
jgi:hypothetical protein